MKIPNSLCSRLAAAAILLWSCNTLEDGEGNQYISLLAPDTLQTFENVLIVARDPITDLDLDTLWNGPVADSEALIRLPIKHYDGGNLDLLILGFNGGFVGYSRLTQYRGGSGTPAMISAPLWDSLPPEMRLRGPHTIALREGEALTDTGAICTDEGGITRISATGSVRAEIAGIYEIRYDCVDRAGNHAFALTQDVQVRLWPDTLPPVFTHPPGDTLAIVQGQVYVDPVQICLDDRDGAILPRRNGILDPGTAGEYLLTYACTDQAGNSATSWIRRILVNRPVDTTRPVIRLLGAESITMVEGASYEDSGAVCLDDRSSTLSALRSGEVDAFRHGEYTLAFVCADSAGNEAFPVMRHVHVVKAPDGVKPVVTLRGSAFRTIHEGDVFADEGAECHDDRDGSLAVSVEGQVNASRRSAYTLIYACADSAGNAADPLFRTITVIRRPDPDKPILELAGKDSLTVFQGLSYSDPGASCIDQRDGVLPVSMVGVVDTRAPGVYSLRFTCADSAGNVGEQIRRVRVASLPDTVSPHIVLIGPDSLTVYDHETYLDPGATCWDDHDGKIPVIVRGSVDEIVRARYSLAFNCVDSAGNPAAEVIRAVKVERRPDTVKPVLTMTGATEVRTVQGSEYADAGAACTDARDGALPVATIGSINVPVPGTYSLEYSCVDSAGNAAEGVARTVTVFAPPDSIKPVITLIGPDTLPVVDIHSFIEPGGACVDDRDGALALKFIGIDPSIGPVDAIYRARYECQDAAGNKAALVRIIKSGLYTENLKSEQETTIDTLHPTWNQGQAAVLSFSRYPEDQFFSFLKFDLAKIKKAGLKFAKLHFLTYGYGLAWPGVWSDYAFRIYGMKQPWDEGNGNHYWFDGGWQNGGEKLLSNYGITWESKLVSVDPQEASGIKGSDVFMVADTNLSLIKVEYVKLFYGKDNKSGPVNPHANLVVVELDITDYVKTSDPAENKGFLIRVGGVPTSRYIAFLTKEIGDGSHAPRLMLGY